MKPSEPTQDTEIKAFLEFLKQSRRFDFTGYKCQSVGRRVDKRVQALHLTNLSDYRDYLEVHPDEFAELFNTILINVTAFYRDAETWDYLREVIVPQIVDRKRPGEPIRLWSAGCASGEEAYTAAMVFAEVLGLSSFSDRVKIFATDVDDDALAQARRATYSESALESLPKEIREKYFVRHGSQFTVCSDLRRSVIFGRHDLAQDAPISHLDLTMCRNVLMYFNAETQTKIVSRIYFGMNPNGYLMLGKAEMLLAHRTLFHATDLKLRMFCKIAGSLAESAGLLDEFSPTKNLSAAIADAGACLFFDVSQDPLIIIEPDGTISRVNDRLRQAFGVTPKDVGRNLSDLEVSYRPIELRSLIDNCCQSRSVVFSDKVTRTVASGGKECWRATVIPLCGSGDAVLAVAIKLEDLSSIERVLEGAKVAAQQLQAANDELQAAREEQETTNEELQSANEELETTNEELQSTNEELETINEELQATNTELDVANQQLNVTGDDLARVNAFLESVLTSIASAVIVLDEDLKIVLWNQQAAEMWGLRSDEVKGTPLPDLDIGLPINTLIPSIHKVLAKHVQHAEITLPAVNRRGKTINCIVKLAERKSADKGPCGIILLMDDVPR